MRVTDRAIFEAARRSTGAARERLETSTREMSTGLRVSHPGDDPVAAALTVRFTADASGHEARGQALDAAVTELDTADNALSGVSALLQQAHELSVQMANGTYSADDRTNAANQIDTLVTSIIGQLNAKFGDRYVFGGTKDDAPPFAANGTYRGATDTRQVELFPGIYQSASVRADQAMTNGNTTMFADLQQFTADLRANNASGIGAAVGKLTTYIDKVAALHSEVGSATNVITMASTAARAAHDELEKRRSTLVEVDAFEAATNLALAQRALDAALTASAKSFDLSLLDKLR